MIIQPNMKNNIAHKKLLTYALNKDNSLVYIKDVPNGLACECVCPCCKEPLIAKNMGKKKEPHFAHSGGCDCPGYYETTLHLLSKEIIRTEKAIMLPEYKSFESQQIVFEKVEIEERKDYSKLQPDCVGITKEGLRFHIEIFVTHPIDDFKKSKIKKGNINCIEIKISPNYPLDKEQLKEFILNSVESREWINFPEGDRLFDEKQKEIIMAYREQHPELRPLCVERCQNCEIIGNNINRAEALNKKYHDFINSYKNRILSWAIPFIYMSPIEVVKQIITVKYDEKSNNHYVWWNGKCNWIFPEDGKYIDLEHKEKCKSTYDFFNKLIYLCMDNLDCVRDYQKCKYYKKQFEFQGHTYVFCSFKP